MTTISIEATTEMSPSARLIGYYILDSPPEVVSDSILLDIQDQFPTKVGITSRTIFLNQLSIAA